MSENTSEWSCSKCKREFNSEEFHQENTLFIPSQWEGQGDSPRYETCTRCTEMPILSNRLTVQAVESTIQAMGLTKQAIESHTEQQELEPGTRAWNVNSSVPLHDSATQSTPLGDKDPSTAFVSKPTTPDSGNGNEGPSYFSKNTSVTGSNGGSPKNGYQQQDDGSNKRRKIQLSEQSANSSPNPQSEIASQQPEDQPGPSNQVKSKYQANAEVVEAHLNGVLADPSMRYRIMMSEDGQTMLRRKAQFLLGAETSRDLSPEAVFHVDECTECTPKNRWSTEQGTGPCSVCTGPDRLQGIQYSFQRIRRSTSELQFIQNSKPLVGDWYQDYPE